MTFDEFWHAQPFGWAACDAMTLARKVWDHQQAEIDELMLEFCPDQMKADQIAEYERHQITVPPHLFAKTRESAKKLGETIAEWESKFGDKTTPNLNSTTDDVA